MTEPHLDMERLPTGATRITLTVDDHDRGAIQSAVLRRLGYVLPEASHDDATLFGRALAEICRGWEELLDVRNVEDDE